MNDKINQQRKRKVRVRSKIFGTGNRPRLSVHRSNRYLSAQIIDDIKRQTLVGLSEKSFSPGESFSPTERARLLGEKIAQMAKKKKISRVVFDRG
ncbi:MAG: 50S ribosomal protein L18, partial [Candidatus Shapirobacteria bacterium]|nr:50S ribosomal protein L18 [Candidatus Shapirobacteria bacterium]